MIKKRAKRFTFVQNGYARASGVHDHFRELALLPRSESQRRRKCPLWIAMVSKRNFLVIIVPKDLPQQRKPFIPIQKNDTRQVAMLS